MSKMLSENSRHLIAQAYQSGVCKAKTLAAIFQTSQTTVYYWAKLEREGKTLKVRTSLRGRKPSLTKQQCQAIVNYCLQHRHTSLAQIKDALNLKASIETIRRVLVKAGFIRKNKGYEPGDQTALTKVMTAEV